MVARRRPEVAQRARGSKADFNRVFKAGLKPKRRDHRRPGRRPEGADSALPRRTSSRTAMDDCAGEPVRIFYRRGDEPPTSNPSPWRRNPVGPPRWLGIRVRIESRFRRPARILGRESRPPARRRHPLGRRQARSRSRGEVDPGPGRDRGRRGERSADGAPRGEEVTLTGIPPVSNEKVEASIAFDPATTVVNRT